jgi:hypothetical protein
MIRGTLQRLIPHGTDPRRTDYQRLWIPQEENAFRHS